MTDSFTCNSVMTDQHRLVHILLYETYGHDHLVFGIMGWYFRDMLGSHFRVELSTKTPNVKKNDGLE